MRFYEIVCEGTGDDMAGTLASILDFLSASYEQSGAKPEIQVETLIGMVRRAGFSNFSYQDLITANEIPTIKNIIQNINEKTVTLKTDTAYEADIENETEQSDESDKYKMSPDEVVDDMAKRSLKKHS